MDFAESLTDLSGAICGLGVGAAAVMATDEDATPKTVAPVVVEVVVDAAADAADDDES